MKAQSLAATTMGPINHNSFEAVDRLRAAAGTLIVDSPEFKRLLKDMGAKLEAQPPAPAGSAKPD